MAELVEAGIANLQAPVGNNQQAFLLLVYLRDAAMLVALPLVEYIQDVN